LSQSGNTIRSSWSDETRSSSVGCIQIQKTHRLIPKPKPPRRIDFAKHLRLVPPVHRHRDHAIGSRGPRSRLRPSEALPSELTNVFPSTTAGQKHRVKVTRCGAAKHWSRCEPIRGGTRTVAQGSRLPCCGPLSFFDPRVAGLPRLGRKVVWGRPADGNGNGSRVYRFRIFGAGHNHFLPKSSAPEDSFHFSQKKDLAGHPNPPPKLGARAPLGYGGKQKI